MIRAFRVAEVHVPKYSHREWVALVEAPARGDVTRELYGYVERDAGEEPCFMHTFVANVSQTVALTASACRERRGHSFSKVPMLEALVHPSEIACYDLRMRRELTGEQDECTVVRIYTHDVETVRLIFDAAVSLASVMESNLPEGGSAHEFSVTQFAAAFAARLGVQAVEWA